MAPPALCVVEGIWATFCPSTRGIRFESLARQGGFRDSWFTERQFKDLTQPGNMSRPERLLLGQELLPLLVDLALNTKLDLPQLKPELLDISNINRYRCMDLPSLPPDATAPL